jgi:2-keto-4-pentenoate hydratase
VTHRRVVDGLREQLESWRAELKGGARRVGWKIGLNVPAVQEQLGIGEPVIGHLTSATLLEPGARFPAAGTTRLVAEPEVALEIGAEGAIAGYAPAIELADVDRELDDVQAIVATNIFHRGVVLGPSRDELPAEGARAVVTVNGEERAAADATGDFADVVELTARLLGEVGERLHEGDRIIAGSITPPVAVEAGDHVTIDLGGLGGLDVQVT